MNGSPLLRGLLWILALLAAGYVLESLHLQSLFSQDWIDNQVRGHGPQGEWLFLGVSVLFTAAGLPRQVPAFFGGYAFGVLFGGLLGLAATVVGCVLSFYLARWLGRGLVLRWFPHRLRRIDRFVGNFPLRMTLLIRLLPVGSNLATNLAAGISSIRPFPFLAGSALGYLPQTLIFALIGSGVAMDPWWRIGSGVLLFLVSSMIGVSLYRRYRRELSQMEEITNQPDLNSPAGHPRAS